MHSIISADRLNSWIKTAVTALAVYIVFYDVFGGLINFILINAHALFLNNVAAVVTVALFGAYLFVSIARLKLERFMLLLTGVIAIYLTYALFDHLSFWQNAFGFYVWTPFLLGTMLCVYGKEEAFFRFMPLFWICSVGGILLNDFIDFPWIGQSYEAHGLTIEAARKWNAFGYNRLSGFARANYSSATVILMCCCYFLASRRYSAIMKFAIYAISCWAIFLTTSKTELITIVLLPPFLYGCRAFRLLWPKTNFDMYFARAVVVFVAGLVVLLPLTLSTHEAGKSSGPTYMFLSADTLVERATWMWPDAFDLLAKDGSILIGRGMGGIGIALGMSDPVPDSVNAADNLFVHVYVELGLLVTIPFFLAFFLKWQKLYDRGPEYFELFYLLAFCVLNIGITAGCIEDPLLALLLGFMVAHAYVTGDRSRRETA